MNTFNTATDSLYVGTANSFWQDEMAFNEQLNALFPNNPYANGAGSFWESEIAFMEDFNAWAWDQSVALAQITPDGQMPPGFGGVHLSNAVTGTQEAFDSLMGTYQDNGLVYDGIHNDWVDYTHGWQTVVDPSTGYVYTGVPNSTYVGFDPINNEIFGSETPIDETQFVSLETYDPFYDRWGVGSFAFDTGF